MHFNTLLRTAAATGVLAALALAPVAHAEIRLNGSGASFPAPIYAKWFKDFSKETKGIRVDYQSKGSGAGIQDLINNVVDFAGSDAAMEDDEIAKVERGVVLLPITAGEVVIAYNLPGVEELRLPRDVYPAIFDGTITNWNDPKIVAANPGVELPDQAITVVVRSDSSGTSYVFTGHLAAISEAFANTVGHSKAPNWPSTDKLIKAPKNDGVTAQVKQIPGSIGYIEYGFAMLTKQPSALLENASGNFVAAGPETGAATLANTTFPDATLPISGAPDLRAFNWDPQGEQSYPIVSLTWLLFYHKQDEENAAALRKLVDFLVSDEAQGQADSLGYIPLPPPVIEIVREASSFIQ